MSYTSQKDEHGEPVPLTKDQWAAMYRTSLPAEADARARHWERTTQAMETLDAPPRHP